MLTIIKKNLFSLCASLIIIYFLFSLLSGERGLISLYKKGKILKELNIENSEIVKKIENLQVKNSLLKDNVDIDLVESLIRDKFVFGKEGETIYIINNNENKN